MTDKIITEKDVEYVAKLARIDISEAEKKRYQEQLEKILGHVSQLKQTPTDGIPPTAHPFDAANVWREDEAHPFKAISELLQNGPDREATYFKVKKVIE